MKGGERQAIITTHSEHMLIRLVRRIADGAINPDDVAVYYLSKEEGKIEVEKVEIKEKGFVSDSFWKFFEEEMQDVFEIRNFDLIPSSYSIFDYHGEEIGRNWTMKDFFWSIYL